MKGQHLKRCLAVLLSLALIITAMPMQVLAASAATSTEASENDVQTASTTTWTVTFYDSDETTVLQTVEVEEGQVPEWTTPVKDRDDYYRYEFAGWNHEVSAAYGNDTYIAEWNRVEYFTATFVDWNDDVLAEVYVDKDTAVADAEGYPADPTRDTDGEYTYTFTGWSPELATAMTEDVTYVAQYDAKEIITYVDLTFVTAENGSYTVNGEEITEEKTFEQTTTKTEYILKATPAEGYEFFGWYADNGTTYLSADAEYTFLPTEEVMIVAPKFVAKDTPRLSVDGNMYEGFDRAITAAKKGSGVMVLMNDVTLAAGDYTIPEGVTLLIPCDEEGTVYRDEPVVIDETWESPVAYRTLTLAEGANLIVNGELSLASPHVPGAGSKENGASPHKTYGHIVTEEGSNITVNDGAFLYAYGYITGEGTVTAKSGATVYEYFQIMDFRGGSATTDMASTGADYEVFPLSQYYVQNIEVPLTIEAGASEYCYTSLKMSGNTLSAAVGFIGDGAEMMFKLKSGTVTKYYDGERDRLVAEIDGDLEISPIVMSGGGNTIDSEDFVLPINSNITIKVNSGTINMTQDVALTPGTELIIGKDATCNLNKNCNIYVYDQDTWGNYCSSNRETFVDLNYAPGRTYTRSEADLVDALIKVEGTLDASKGYLYTTEGGANICSEGEGTIILRKGEQTATYQFEYIGPSKETDEHYPYYGKYYDISITAALLKNADGSFVNQDELAVNNIVKYTYTDGVWEPVGHAYNEYEAEEANCLIEGRTYGTDCAYGEACAEHYNPSVVIPALGHEYTVEVDAKSPTYTSIGWEAHKQCERCGAKDPETYVEIPKLEGAVITSYDEFLENLEILEQWANDYVKANPGKDPVALVIKYIRTGVDRYNSGSWNIMAGYEDSGFAEYVAATEDKLNSTAAENGEELLKVSGMKNILSFEIPNGDEVDFGHMFGTMDITYHNNFSVNHADVAGWAGDIVDLLSIADQFGTGDAETINEMADYIYENYLFKETEELEDEFGEELKEGSFSIVDMYGDLDAYWIMKNLEATEYENGALTELVKAYFTEDLNDFDRADYLLMNRFDDISLRIDLRDEVYRELTGNNVISTLEATREFESDNLADLRKACAYAFADYICKTAGDYVDSLENPYISVFNSTFSTLAPGITLKKYNAKTADGLQTDYYTATIDVTREDVQVCANYKDNQPDPDNWGMQTVPEQAQAAQDRYGDPESDEYIENYNVIASINAGGYDMANGEPGGLLVMKGVEYAPINSDGFFAILKDGTAMIGTTAQYNNGYKELIEEAIGGFGTTLVKNGKVHITATTDYYTSRSSRTAVGITKSGKVVFMVMDGRQGEYTCGGSMEEIAQVMLDAGCVEAINLDGGGSSTFVAREEGETTLSVINKPSDGTPRSVSTSLFAYSTAPSSTEFDHAVLESTYNYLTVDSSVTLTASGVSATNNAVEMPEGTTWTVSDTSIGEITEEGVFTAKAEGDVDVQLMLEDEVIGSKTLHVVKPDNLYFTRPSMNAIYGQTITMPINAVYENKNVAINGNDITFTLSDATAGEFDGLTLSVAETQLKTVKVTATLPNNTDAKATLTVYLYNEDEASFDFDKAIGGDEQLAWNREVSNAITNDTLTYSAIDVEEDMTTEYTFAIDMSKIDIPEKLSGLVYMLPGAEKEDASAWTFLCQLAERMSDLTEVKPVIKFDENVDVDYSGLTLMNEYFTLNGKEFDEETNTLTLTLNWKKQDKPIDTALANPICILSGIKITPKDDATWNAKKQLKIVNSGEISYTVYMRASGLYTFSQKEENQQTYGLYAYDNTANRDNDRGGYFTSVYKQFEDSFTLDKSIKNGWVATSGGFSYFDQGKMYTGICLIDGLYYDFGENGINKNQTPYSGEYFEDGKEYYIFSGEIFKKGCKMWNDSTDDGWIRFGTNDWRYYDPETGVREQTTVEVKERTCIIDTKRIFTTESGLTRTIWDNDAGGHEYKTDADGNAVCTVCGWERMDMEDVEVSFTYTQLPYNGSARIPSVTAKNPVTGDVLSKVGDYKDYGAVYSNNVEVGKANVVLTAKRHGIYANINEWRGSYKGSVTVHFTIHPDTPTNVAATRSDNQVKLTWTVSKVAETDTDDNKTTYVIYQYLNGTWKEIGETEDTTYTVNVASTDTARFNVGARKTGTDGELYESLSYGFVKIEGETTVQPDTDDTTDNTTDDTTTVEKTKLKTPTVTASNVASTGKIKLTWKKISGAEKYKIYRATSKNGKYTYMNTVTGTSYINKTAKAGKKYYYKVVAVDTDSKYANSAYSKIVVRTCDLARPVVKATNVASTGKIKLTWKKIAGAQKYAIYRATSKNGKYTYMNTVTGTSYINKTAKAGKTYYYKVKAIKKGNSAANSAFSVVDKKICKLARPVIKLNNATKGQIKVTWKKVTGATSYKVYRKVGNGKFKYVTTTKKLTYTNKGLKKGKKYSYKVVAVKKGNTKANSAYSVVKYKKAK